MDVQSFSRVVEAERTRDGVIITFADGRSAFYPSSLLSAVFEKAQRLSEAEQGPPDVPQA